MPDHFQDIPPMKLSITGFRKFANLHHEISGGLNEGSVSRCCDMVILPKNIIKCTIDHCLTTITTIYILVTLHTGVRTSESREGTHVDLVRMTPVTSHTRAYIQA